MPQRTVAQRKDITQLARELWAAGDAPAFSAAIYKASKMLDSLHDFADSWDRRAQAQADEAEAYEADEDGPLAACGICGEQIEVAVLAVGDCPCCDSIIAEVERQELERVVYVPSALTPAEARAMDKALFERSRGLRPQVVGRFAFVPSRSAGGTVYRTALDGSSCNCAAGEAGRLCWHRMAVVLEHELAA